MFRNDLIYLILLRDYNRILIGNADKPAMLPISLSNVLFGKYAKNRVIYFFNTSFEGQPKGSTGEAPGVCRENMVGNMNDHIDNILKEVFQIHFFGVNFRPTFGVIVTPSAYLTTNYVYANSVVLVKESGIRSTHTGNVCRVGAFSTSFLPAGQVVGKLQEDGGIVSPLFESRNLYYSFMIDSKSRTTSRKNVISCSESKFWYGKNLIAFANVANSNSYDFTGSSSLKPNLRLEYSDRGAEILVKVSNC